MFFFAFLPSDHSIVKRPIPVTWKGMEGREEWKVGKRVLVGVRGRKGRRKGKSRMCHDHNNFMIRIPTTYTPTQTIIRTFSQYFRILIQYSVQWGGKIRFLTVEIFTDTVSRRQLLYPRPKCALTKHFLSNQCFVLHHTV